MRQTDDPDCLLCFIRETVGGCALIVIGIMLLCLAAGFGFALGQWVFQFFL